MNDFDINEIDKVLLTIIRSLSHLNQKNLIIYFQKILNHFSNHAFVFDLIENFVNERIFIINKKISDQGFKIKRVKDELSNEFHYVYTNSVMNNDNRSFTTYSKNEIQSLKLIIDTIMIADNNQFSIERKECEKIICKKLLFSLRDASLFIEKVINDGWINLTKKNKLILTLRLFAEMKTYMINRYKDIGIIHICKLCEDLVTIGVLIKKKNTTDLYFHYECHKIYLRNETEIESQGIEIIKIGIKPNSF